MFLKESSTSHLVEVLSLNDLFDPHKGKIVGRYNVGEEMPEAANFDKAGLVFPSNENLPRCWVDVHYRDHELRQ